MSFAALSDAHLLEPELTIQELIAREIEEEASSLVDVWFEKFPPEDVIFAGLMSIAGRELSVEQISFIREKMDSVKSHNLIVAAFSEFLTDAAKDFVSSEY